MQCDGTIPTCGPCHRRHVECTYASDPTKSRFSALRAERDQLLSHHNSHMKLYDRLKHGSPSEVSRLVERIRSTDGIIDMASLDCAYKRPSEASYDTSRGTTFTSERGGHRATTGHSSAQIPSPLPDRMQGIAQTNSIDVPIDSAPSICSSGLPHQSIVPSIKPASSHLEGLEAADWGLVASAHNYGISKAVRQQLCSGTDTSTAPHQNTRRFPPAVPYVQGRAPATLLAPEVAQFSSAQVQPSNFAAGPSSSPNLDVPGRHEDAIYNYVLWQTRKVSTEEWKSQFIKAGDVLLEQGFRLKLFYETNPIHLLLEGGVSKGIALSFHGDVPVWLSDLHHGFEKGDLYTSETWAVQ